MHKKQYSCILLSFGMSYRGSKKNNYIMMWLMFNALGSANFAQWRYSNQWSIREVLLLLVENYTQYPAWPLWNTNDQGNFWWLIPKLHTSQLNESIKNLIQLRNTTLNLHGERERDWKNLGVKVFFDNQQLPLRQWQLHWEIWWDVPCDH